MFLYFADEFGSIDIPPPEDATPASYNPIFGIGGLAIRARNYDRFAKRFVELKSYTFGGDVDTAAKREKKGGDIFKTAFFSRTNARGEPKSTGTWRKQRNTRRVAELFLQELAKSEAFIVYQGLEKYSDRASLHPNGLMMAMARRIVMQAHQHCIDENHSAMVIFDEHSIKDHRKKIIRQIINEKNMRPYLPDSTFDQVSDLSTGIQAADWVCALLGKFWSYRSNPQKHANLLPLVQHFEEPLNKLTHRFSAVRLIGGGQGTMF